VAAAGGTAYHGRGDAAAVVLSFHRHGRLVDFKVTYQSPCDMAGVVDSREWDSAPTAGVPRLRLDRNGRFRLDGHYQGSSTTFDMHIAGRIGDRRAAGTFTAHSVTSDVTCDTGLVHWTARRR
jgi:hypothetical protein